MGALAFPRVLMARVPHGRFTKLVATVAVATVAVAGASLIPNSGGPVTPPGPGTANIWVDANGGACVDSTTPVAYVDANACGSLDAANDTCDNGDTVYVKTASSYPGETLTGNNGRSAVCTIAAEPSTGRMVFTGDLNFGSDGSASTNPNWLGVSDVQCGTQSKTNGVDTTMFDTSNLTLNNWLCSSFDIFGGSNVTISNSDFGVCGSALGRKCLNRIALSSPGEGNILIQDTSLHDIYCGNDNATDCANAHTDGLAIFGGANITLRRVKFYRNDITNIRIQNCCGNNAISNLTIESSWFTRPCIDNTGTAGACDGGFRADTVDVDTPVANFTFRFNTFTDQGYLDCNSTGANACGTSGGQAILTGNIFSPSDPSCSYGFTTWSYNVVNPWGGGSGAACGTNIVTTHPTLVNASDSASPPDLHLSSSSTTANAAVVSGCIANDIDLEARPPNNCDAGSDER